MDAWEVRVWKLQFSSTRFITVQITGYPVHSNQKTMDVYWYSLGRRDKRISEQIKRDSSIAIEVIWQRKGAQVKILNPAAPLTGGKR